MAILKLAKIALMSLRLRWILCSLREAVSRSMSRCEGRAHRSASKRDKARRASLMFEGRLEMYILLIAGSALRCVPMRMVFLKPVSGITDSGDFVVKKAPRGALESGQMLRKWDIWGKFSGWDVRNRRKMEFGQRPRLAVFKVVIRLCHPPTLPSKFGRKGKKRRSWETSVRD